MPAALASGHATGDKPGASEKAARENSMEGQNAITGVTGAPNVLKKNKIKIVKIVTIASWEW